MRKMHIESGHLKQARRHAMMLTLLREYRAATPSYFLHIIIQLYIVFVNSIFQFSIAKYSYL